MFWEKVFDLLNCEAKWGFKIIDLKIYAYIFNELCGLYYQFPGFGIL